MSRVYKCIENGLMEELFGPLKSEILNGMKFTSLKDLCDKITIYIQFSNSKRMQKN